MKTLTLLSTATINESKLSVLVEFYNEYATELGIKTIKKFRDKETAQKRVKQIQEQYAEELAEEKAKAEKPAKKAKAEKLAKKAGRKSDLDMQAIIGFNKNPDELKEGTIEYALVHAIIDLEDGDKEDWSVTVQQVVDHIVETHNRPRSNLGVDSAYAIHNIRWFLRKGTLKLVK